MYIIAGLGNPGKQYENTRHNMGFMAVDVIARDYDIKIKKIKFKSLVGEGVINDKKVILIKPQTYMNSSGESLREVMQYYKEDIENLIVIYDDFDIEIGSLRIRKKGSSGSHNGMKSVIYQLQNDNFPRIRVGIGASNGEDWKDYVTGEISKKEHEILSTTIENAAKAAVSIVSEGIDLAMNKYNVRVRPVSEDSSTEKID